MSPKKSRGLAASVVRRLPQVEDCETPLLKCLWALRAAKLSGKYPDFITASAISEVLLEADATNQSII